PPRCSRVGSCARSPSLPPSARRHSRNCPPSPRRAFPVTPPKAGTVSTRRPKRPPNIIDRLNKSAAKAVESEAFKRLGVNEGLVMVARPPDELDRYVRG